MLAVQAEALRASNGRVLTPLQVVENNDAHQKALAAQHLANQQMQAAQQNAQQVTADFLLLSMHHLTSIASHPHCLSDASFCKFWLPSVFIIMSSGCDLSYGVLPGPQPNGGETVSGREMISLSLLFAASSCCGSCCCTCGSRDVWGCSCRFWRKCCWRLCRGR